jgi:hypothetical protein
MNRPRIITIIRCSKEIKILMFWAAANAAKIINTVTKTG